MMLSDEKQHCKIKLQAGERNEPWIVTVQECQNQTH